MTDGSGAFTAIFRSGLRRGGVRSSLEQVFALEAELAAVKVSRPRSSRLRRSSQPFFTRVEFLFARHRGAVRREKKVRLLEATLTRGEGAVSAKLADLRSAYDVQERELLHARRQVTT